MTVQLTVSDVVAALPRRRDSAVASSSLLVGRMFHETFQTLATGRHDLWTLLQDTSRDGSGWEEALGRHAYDNVVGPLLAQHQSELHANTQTVLDYWSAVQSLLDWFLRLAREGTEPEELVRRLGQLRDSLRSELPMQARLREPGWTDEVVLSGVADAVLRVPGTNKLCIIELKTGGVPQEAALSQACLYSLCLRRSGHPAPVDLGVLRFGREVEDVTYPADRLKELESRVLNLVGELAGVLPGKSSEALQTPSKDEADPTSASDHAKEDVRERSSASVAIEQAFSELGIVVRCSAEPMVGPTFLRYELELGKGATWSKLQRMEEELPIRMRSDSPITLQRDVGRIYLDVERPDREVILYDALPQTIRRKPSEPIVGVSIGGEVKTIDLADSVSPHLLVAGTTGSGKSEWLSLALASLCEVNTPDSLRLVLIDPKRTAFGGLGTSSFLWDRHGLVLPPDDPVDQVFTDLVEEMEARYRLFTTHGVSNLDELGEHARPPRLIVACDELLDLLVAAEDRKGLEKQLTRLTAKARAAGIHLILATQQPRRDVLSPNIQANLPAKIALKTASSIEARMMQCPDAHGLLGKGDLFFKLLGDPVRLQAPLVPSEQRNRLFRVQEG